MELEEAIELIEMDLDDIVYYLGKQCNFEYGQQVGESILKLIKYIKEESIPRAAIEEKIKWCKEIADNGANAVRFAMTHEDEIERIERQKNLSTFIDILQELLNKGE